MATLLHLLTLQAPKRGFKCQLGFSSWAPTCSQNTTNRKDWLVYYRAFFFTGCSAPPLILRSDVVYSWLCRIVALAPYLLMPRRHGMRRGTIGQGKRQLRNRRAQAAIQR